jgi:DNA-binding CsgD family transcriptional regulator
LGDVHDITIALILLGMIALARGEPERAAAAFEEDLHLLRKLGDTDSIIHCLLGLARVAIPHGEPARAARLWGAAEALQEAIGSVVTASPFVRSQYDHENFLDAVRSRLDEEAWEAAWAEGRAMSPEQAIEYALCEEEQDPPTTLVPVPEQQPPTDEPTERLTPREQEIAVLVGRGLTNRRIAEELVISEHTVATHVRKILKKLRLRSRAQISI